nr:uncharacterized protein LOC121502219 [Drosophila kikkawai]
MDFNAEVQILQRGVTVRDELLCELVEILRDHEPGLKRVIQSIYTLVQDNLLCNTQLVHKVISAVISGSQDETSTRRRLLARALVCVQLQVRRIPADEGALMLHELLARASDDVHPYAGQILGHLFNDFVRVLGADCFLRLLDATRTILLSKEPQDRKSSYFLISKIQRMCEIDGEHSEALLNGLQCSAQQWIAFAVIVADLEEQDPNLVGITLETQLPQLQLMSSDLGERWLAWLRTICIRLLQEDRVQVLRKTLEYFLTHLSVEYLCRLGLLPEFLMATNRSQLFDPEGDNWLNGEQVKQFVAKGNVELLLEALVVVSWENVPLLVWIRSLESEQVESVPKELFIKLCLNVKAIDNYDLREGARDHVILIFKDTIDGFSLRDYIVYMESLFNKGDLFPESQRLKDKIGNCTDFEEHIDFFSRRFFDIFLCYDRCSFGLQPDLSHTLFSKMETLPKQKHGFLRFVFITKNEELFTRFYRKFYNVDTSLLQKGKSLGEMQVHLLDRLDCQTDEETSFLKARCVDLFTLNMDSWAQLEELNLDPLELLEQGTYDTILALARLLESHQERITDDAVLPALISRLKSYDFTIIENVVNYAYRILTEEEFESVYINLMLQTKYVWLPGEKLSISLYLKLLLHGEPTTGMAR